MRTNPCPLFWICLEEEEDEDKPVETEEPAATEPGR